MSGQDKDSSNDFIWVMIFMIGVYLLVTLFFGETITALHLKMRQGWAWLGATITPFKVFDNVLLAIKSNSPREILNHPTALKQISSDLLLIMFLPLSLIVGYYSYRINKNIPAHGLRKKYTRVDLLNAQAKLWPWVVPILGTDLIKLPVLTGMWSMAKRPVDFCRQYRLLNGKSLDKNRAEKLFSTQLGKLWEGPKKLPPYSRALFACIIAHLCKDKVAASNGLEILARGMALAKVSFLGPKTKDEIDYSYFDALIKKHYEDERVQQIIVRYAYNNTVMMALLKEARNNGILPSSFFIWMRPRNRALWYCLNSVGRFAVVTEAAGVYSHFLAEEIAGHRIEQPYVKEAVLALEIALREYIFETEEEIQVRKTAHQTMRVLTFKDEAAKPVL